MKQNHKKNQKKEKEKERNDVFLCSSVITDYKILTNYLQFLLRFVILKIQIYNKCIKDSVMGFLAQLVNIFKLIAKCRSVA